MGQGSFHVTIIGAGLGGLCLGQALKRRGIAFDIHERDPSLAARPQGYRIRIDRAGREALAIRSAAAIDPGAWPRGVTFLGDAIHVMSPAGGLGANTALADAAQLAARLGEAAAGEAALSEAIATYADDLHRRATAAVRASADAAAALFASPSTPLTKV